jgi:hypothetical protein
MGLRVRIRVWLSPSEFPGAITRSDVAESALNSADPAGEGGRLQVWGIHRPQVHRLNRISRGVVSLEVNGGFLVKVSGS